MNQDGNADIIEIVGGNKTVCGLGMRLKGGLGMRLQGGLGVRQYRLICDALPMLAHGMAWAYRVIMQC